MKLEVLVATMNQKDFKNLSNLNLKTNAIVINQCDENNYNELKLKGNLIRIFSNTNRGLSKSRNEALLYADSDICILCDDDVSYHENYENIIIGAFKELKEADVIIFDVNKINDETKLPRRKITRIKKAPFYKSYGSVKIAFRLEAIKKSNVWFNTQFGAGSKYGSGEESIFLKDLRKKGLKVYEYPAVIADVDCSTSTWFQGYNEKYCFDKGAYLAANHKYLKYIYKYYYWFRLKEYSNVNIIKYINKGIKEYKNS